MNLSKPPAGIQVDRKKELIVLHSDAKHRIVESIGGYPVLMRATTDVIVTDEGYLMSDTNARLVKARLAAFVKTCDPKTKRWGELLRAYVKSDAKNTYTELVPYPRLRDILVELTPPAPAVPAAPATQVAPAESIAPTETKTISEAETADTKKTTKTEKIAKPTAHEAEKTAKPPKKRDAEPDKENVHVKAPAPKRVKLETISSERQLANITNEQLMYVLGEYQEKPDECPAKYPFLLEASLRGYLAVKNYFVNTE